MNVIIIGASGGIGRALFDAIKAAYPEANVSGTYFSQDPGLAGVTQLDATDEQAVVQYAEKYAEEFDQVDWLINCAGFLHGNDTPEKSVRHIESEFFLQNIKRNTLPTLLLARYFQKHLRKSEAGVFAAISARVGSISDNQLGGWYSYRSSKAALNMFLKGLAIEWQRSLPRCSVAALHPGTTDTALSEPFQKNVPESKLFTPAQTAGYLIQGIEELDPKNTGRFWAYDGTEIPW
jgi:NAD(P)-dependent dehydrogenase (short-subunit alcohol dehydrogenase family)